MKSVPLLLAAVLTAAVAPAFAADPPPSEPNKITTLVVYGDDPCPRAADDEVVVCTRRPEEERYRIAPNLRPSGTRQERESWATRAQDLKSVGSTGIGACSPVGPGGHTGCLVQDIERAMKENDEADQQGAVPEL